MENTQKLQNSIKKIVFYEILNSVGRVFIVIRYSDAVSIGTRGFTEDEMKNGLVLVFNSRMNFTWDEYGISVTLVFGTSPIKCFVPSEDIISVYSPELNSQLVIVPATKQQPDKTEHPQEQPEENSDKVIKVDFRKNKGK